MGATSGLSILYLACDYSIYIGDGFRCPTVSLPQTPRNGDLRYMKHGKTQATLFGELGELDVAYPDTSHLRFF